MLVVRFWTDLALVFIVILQFGLKEQESWVPTGHLEGKQSKANRTYINDSEMVFAEFGVSNDAISRIARKRQSFA